MCEMLRSKLELLPFRRLAVWVLVAALSSLSDVDHSSQPTRWWLRKRRHIIDNTLEGKRVEGLLTAFECRLLVLDLETTSHLAITYHYPCCIFNRSDNSDI